MRVAAALAALVLATGIARAGDYADLEVIGFSPDGGAFAFEEYGVQDGSGFPYSNISVVETTADRWVTGTPVRVQLNSDQATLASARKQARDKAKGVLAATKIGAPATVLAANPATEVSADPHHVVFLLSVIAPGGGKPYDLVLTENELPAPSCPNVGQPFKGFSLVLTDPQGIPRTLASDSSIPGSRRCPLGYAITEVVTNSHDKGQPVLVVIVSVFSVGFEGQDRRFVAVSSRLP
jgi:predicted secreted protein